MTYRLLLHKNVTSFIAKRSDKQRQAIKQKLEMLKIDPYQNSELDIKAMKGYDNLFRLRIGQYRFIYQINNDELIVFVLKGGNRGDVYKGI